MSKSIPWSHKNHCGNFPDVVSAHTGFNLMENIFMSQSNSLSIHRNHRKRNKRFISIDSLIITMIAVTLALMLENQNFVKKLFKK